MFKKNLFNAINEIETPERKLNVLMPVMALMVVASVVYSLYTKLDHNNQGVLDDCKGEVIELKKENKALVHANDSLIYKAIDDKQQTINKLKILINQQEKQKK